MKRWLRDSLFKRFFLLMWGALVLSHLAAFAAVMLWQPPALPSLSAAAAPRSMPLPTFPSLPPTPGVPDTGLMRPAPAPGADDTADSDLPAPPGPRFAGLPGPALLLDYAVRLLVIALAAWWGVRWVTAPMRRLADAARQLGPALREDGPAPALDEAGGTAEVREAAQVFNAMARQLQQQFRARTLLMAAVSHDVRTPLTRLRLRLERLDEDVSLVRRCIADVREIDALVESALELVRSEQAQEPRRATDLLALAQAVADDRTEQGSVVRCDSESDGEPATVRVQPAALRRVLDNLLDNALRHGTQAALALHIESGWVRLTVDDDGPGIPEERLQAALDPFVQLGADPRRHHRAGLGLGLYIAHDLVRRQGGTLTLANRAGGGLRAEVRLPAA